MGSNFLRRTSACEVLMPRRCRKLCSRAVAVVATAACTVVARPDGASAHVGQAGGVSVSALVLAGVAVVLCVAGMVVASRRKRRPGLALFVAGIVGLTLAGADFYVDQAPASSPAVVRIVEPTWGAKVPQRFDVSVQLDNAVLVPMDRTSGTPQEGHLHLFANGRAVGMYSETRFPVELPPGRYVLQVEFTGVDHLSFSPPVADTVEVEVVQPNQGTSGVQG